MESKDLVDVLEKASQKLFEQLKSTHKEYFITSTSHLEIFNKVFGVKTFKSPNDIMKSMNKRVTQSDI